MEWYCEICDFFYNEINGMPDDGIPPNTKFEDIPDEWVCPICGIDKTYFKLTSVNIHTQTMGL